MNGPLRRPATAREARIQALNEPVHMRSMVDVITERIEQAILVGDLPLGCELNEKQMAEQLGVSRSPLREALRSLEGKKLVERLPNLGPRVVSISPADVREIYLLRGVLEGLACRLAAEGFTAQQRSDLQRLATQGRQQVAANLKSYSFVKDLDFHQFIIFGTGNRRLSDLLMGELHYLLRVLRARARGLVERPVIALDEHMAIAEAIDARDGDRAESLMRAHVAAAGAELIRSIELQATGEEPVAPQKR